MQGLKVSESTPDEKPNIPCAKIKAGHREEGQYQYQEPALPAHKKKSTESALLNVMNVSIRPLLDFDFEIPSDDGDSHLGPSGTPIVLETQDITQVGQERVDRPFPKEVAPSRPIDYKRSPRFEGSQRPQVLGLVVIWGLLLLKNAALQSLWNH